VNGGEEDGGVEEVESVEDSIEEMESREEDSLEAVLVRLEVIPDCIIRRGGRQ